MDGDIRGITPPFGFHITERGHCYGPDKWQCGRGCTVSSAMLSASGIHCTAHGI